MAEQITSISPAILKWARTSLGLQIHEVAEEMGKDQETIESWEQGATFPTYAQLEKLAYAVYKRPIATFFLPEPPQESDVRAEFRIYLGNVENRLSKDTLLAMRDARVKQLNLEEFHLGDSPGPSFLDEIGKLMSKQPDLRAVATKVRTILDVDESAIATAPNSAASLNIWRAAIEDRGIFVFKRAFKQNNISGFCLRHSQFPLIYLNNKTSFTRQTFTIAHELCHLALDVSGVCAIDLEYAAGLQQNDRKTEEYCDGFAAELLVPSDSFMTLRIDPDRIASLLAAAKHFHVSPAVIARKCFDLKMVTRQRLNELMAEFFVDNWRTVADDDDKGSGGNYYNTQLQYLSRRYLMEAYQRFSRGQISDQVFADYLGMKVSNLAGLESKFLTQQA